MEKFWVGNRVECSLEIYVSDSDRTVLGNGESPVISRFEQISDGGVFPEEAVLSFIYEMTFGQIVISMSSEATIDSRILQQVHVRAMGR